jgi:Zn-finger nucleic acid-binding protein
MRCPSDGSMLRMIDRAGLDLEYCPECRGVWLERDELDKLLDEPDDNLIGSQLSYGMPRASKSRSLMSELFDF